MPRRPVKHLVSVRVWRWQFAIVHSPTWVLAVERCKLNALTFVDDVANAMPCQWCATLAGEHDIAPAEVVNLGKHITESLFALPQPVSANIASSLCAILVANVKVPTPRLILLLNSFALTLGERSNEE